MAAPMAFQAPRMFISNWLTSCKFHRNFKHKAHSRHYSSIKSSKSLIYSENGDPRKVITLQEVPLPEINSDSVLIQMVASPVNPADINTIQGIYPIKPPLPAIPGFEGVGEILEVGGNVTSITPGERVIIHGTLTGTWRSHLVCPASQVMPVPRATPTLVAATLKVNACTAYRMLADFEHLEEGDTVIQNAANSGVGQALIQIAAAQGLRTINIVRDRPNLDELSAHLYDLGATVVTTEGALRKEASALLKDLPKPKLALNAVGGKSVIPLVKHLQPSGTVVTYGGMSKQPVMVPTGSLIFHDLKFKGYWMTRWHAQHADGERAKLMLQELCSWGESGQLRAPQHRLVSIDDYGSALEKALSEYTSEKQILTF